MFRRHAFVDDLTGLANRREFYRFMAVMATKGMEKVTLILCDVDRFKEVNDNWGHPVGDMVLVEVASILSASVRSADVAARLGGDEFALLLGDLDLAAAEPRAKAIVRGRGWAPGSPRRSITQGRRRVVPGEDGGRVTLHGGTLRLECSLTKATSHQTGLGPTSVGPA